MQNKDIIVIRCCRALGKRFRLQDLHDRFEMGATITWWQLEKCAGSGRSTRLIEVLALAFADCWINAGRLPLVIIGPVGYSFVADLEYKYPERVSSGVVVSTNRLIAKILANEKGELAMSLHPDAVFSECRTNRRIKISREADEFILELPSEFSGSCVEVILNNFGWTNI